MGYNQDCLKTGEEALSRDLQVYVDRVQHLRVGRKGDHERPHKPVMLLAVIDLFTAGSTDGNRIRYSPELLEVFHRYFKIVQSGDDQPNAHLPFWHLRGDKFFHHSPKIGMGNAYEVIKQATSPGDLNSVVDYAYLDEELFSLLSSEHARGALRDAIINRYFANYRAEILAISAEESEIGAYRNAIERQMDDQNLSVSEVREVVRGAAFSRSVRQAYDYQCSACGIRFVLDDIFIVDAAHLIPFSETQDDDPRNGIALCKNHHWIMDKALIAPGVDLRWHVSKALDERIPGQKDLLELQSRTLLLPSNERYYPRQDALEWRMKRLVKG